MLWMLIGTVVAFAVLVLAFAAIKRPAAPQTSWPVYSKRVLNEREQVIFHRLRLAYPEHVVLAQVALSQMIGTKQSKGSTAVFNRYSRLVADFVVCSRDFRPLAVFELDGVSHDAPKRADADARKQTVLEAAGIAVVRLNSKAPNDEASLHAAFAPPRADRGNPAGSPRSGSRATPTTIPR